MSTPEGEDTTVADDEILDDQTDPDDLGDEPVIVSPDPAEYSDAPHMGSVPRPMREEAFMPDTQGDDPLEAELGEDGQGDLAPEDL